MKRLTVHTPGRGLHDITLDVADCLPPDANGLCHVFLHHTSASLIITENADPDVHRDMLDWFAKHVPDGDPAYRHDDEGPDDMPSHIRSVLTQPSLLVPVQDGRLQLGTWQGMYVFEHRTAPHTRRLTVSILAA